MNEVDIDKIIMRGLVQPSNPGAILVPSCNYFVCFPDFAENLAYEVDKGFGREFKSWLQGEGRYKGAKARVSFLQSAKECNQISF